MGFVQGSRFKQWFTRKAAPEISTLNLSRSAAWVGKYPDVPPPDARVSVRLIAAQWRCHQLYGEDLPRVAMNLLEAGYDSPGLRRLAGETQVSCSADVEDLVARVHRDFDIPYPMPEKAAQLMLTRQIAREVIAGARDPWLAELDLKEIWNWHPEMDDVARVLHLCDESVWSDEEQRYVPDVTPELLDTFARLAKLSDDQIAS